MCTFMCGFVEIYCTKLRIDDNPETIELENSISKMKNRTM